IKFGRFAEPEETDEMAAVRNAADKLYKEGDFLGAYVSFFEYMRMQGGPAVEIVFNEDTQMLHFDIIQGSKIVKGAITAGEVFTWADIATFDTLDVALMRSLLTQNTNFAYCKFAVYDNIISLMQRCPIKDMSPGAFNEMLSEIAITSDSVDDVLVEQFPNLHAINTENIISLPESEISAKIKFLHEWIHDAQQQVQTTVDDPTRTYIILTAIFKILYLISPEGSLLHHFRQIYSIYANGYNPEERNSPEINHKMLTELEDIDKKSDNELKSSIYKVRAVFPEISYMAFAEMAESLNSHFVLIDTCIDSGRYDLVQTMCEYAAGLNHVHHGMPSAAQDLLLIFWRVLNQDYFNALGFDDEFISPHSQTLAAIKISKEIDETIKKYTKVYPNLSFNTANLDFGTIPGFAYTFLKEFAALEIPD
ncbi:MAG: hypothetical protein IKS00_05805, partial [Bacteroidales bacterium]|nr:hypothetical protein [Bacteroidales bacterium]